jgi:hypothetical protein
LNPTDYTFLLSHPEAVNERQTDALERIVTEFPYFQSARALRLKGLYNQNSFQYNYALKVTAAYTTDRSVLFDFITSDSFTAIQKGLYEQKLAEIEGITVKDSLHVSDNDKVERPTDSELAKQSILTSIRESENRETVEDETLETHDSLQNTAKTVDDSRYNEQAQQTIDAEDFGPINEEPQFLPEAIAPVEFTHIEPSDFVSVDEINAVETDAVQPIDAETPAPIEAANEDITAIEPVSESAQVTAIQTETELIKDKLDIGKPLTFAKDETHSFAEWLQLTKLQPIVRDENQAEAIKNDEPAEIQPTEKISKDTLIDRFIEANPKMPKVKADVTPVTIEQKEDTSALMTETLARVYLEQRKYQKAIQAYEILILKYPEKSSFFADRISEIKNLQQNNIL